MNSDTQPPTPDPRNDAETPKPTVSLFRRFYQHLVAGGNYVATSLIVNAFLFFDSTLEVRVYGKERLKAIKRAGLNPLLVIWHGQGLVPMAVFRHERLCLYASHTREENYPRHLLLIRWWTLRFIERMGYQILDASVFKSESRGVMKFVELLRGGTGSVIAADGPAGPIYQAKPGPPFLAKKSGVVLLPIGVALSQGFQLDQWDKFEVPWPFAEAVICIGEPIVVPAKAKDEEMEAARLLLETEMNRLMGEAHQRLKLRSGGEGGAPMPPERAVALQ